VLRKGLARRRDSMKRYCRRESPKGHNKMGRHLSMWISPQWVPGGTREGILNSGRDGFSNLSARIDLGTGERQPRHSEALRSSRKYLNQSSVANNVGCRVKMRTDEKSTCGLTRIRAVSFEEQQEVKA
jgi:hypothetical protein